MISDSPKGRQYYALHKTTKQQVMVRVLRKERIKVGSAELQAIKLERELQGIPWVYGRTNKFAVLLPAEAVLLHGHPSLLGL